MLRPFPRQKCEVREIAVSISHNLFVCVLLFGDEKRSVVTLWGPPGMYCDAADLLS